MPGFMSMKVAVAVEAREAGGGEGGRERNFSPIRGGTTTTIATTLRCRRGTSTADATPFSTWRAAASRPRRARDTRSRPGRRREQEDRRRPQRRCTSRRTAAPGRMWWVGGGGGVLVNRMRGDQRESTALPPLSMGRNTCRPRLRRRPSCRPRRDCWTADDGLPSTAPCLNSEHPYVPSWYGSELHVRGRAGAGRRRTPVEKRRRRRRRRRRPITMRLPPRIAVCARPQCRDGYSARFRVWLSPAAPTCRPRGRPSRPEGEGGDPRRRRTASVVVVVERRRRRRQEQFAVGQQQQRRRRRLDHVVVVVFGGGGEEEEEEEEEERGTGVWYNARFGRSPSRDSVVAYSSLLPGRRGEDERGRWGGSALSRSASARGWRRGGAGSGSSVIATENLPKRGRVVT